MSRNAPAFWDNVNKAGPNGCWLWTGVSCKPGYGRFGRGPALAHRVAYEKLVGTIPAGVCLLHKCDTPACVNPKHMFLGSRTDNQKDSMLKGRQAKKLTPEHVRWIREWAASGVAHANIAALFNVSQVMVSKIVRGAAWAWVA